MRTEKSETYEILELNNSMEKAKMHYYNSKGESGNMIGYMIQNQFKIEGNQIKFEDILDNKNSKLDGKWILPSDLNEWVGFIDLKPTKLNLYVKIHITVIYGVKKYRYKVIGFL
ncbi:hypothetical protein [Pedobacter sp.]|uniref:hypothetical protein n=1 Tax=Pedobacter sp. TaxID=1411316 RepID=UPI003C682E1C